MPSVFISGSRQAGKSTLAYKIAKENLNAEYVSFDDLSLLSFAKSNPEGFLDQIPKPAVIDEVQMAPELFIHLKQYIDRKRLANENPNGDFLLTGSSSVTTIPSLAEALVGRVFLITLLPFSSSEIAQKNDNFIPMIFREETFVRSHIREAFSLSEAIRKATFPQLSIDTKINPSDWFNSYIQTLLNRDVRNIAQIEKLHELPHILKVMASRTGGLINDADLARTTQLNQMTFRRYRSLLSNVFLTFLVPPWFGNIGKRLIKAPKIYFSDTMLMIYLLGYEVSGLKTIDMNITGMVLENYVATELQKQLSVSGDGSLFFFRTGDNKEVDFIIEKRNGEMVGIEVKNSATITSTDFAGLRFLKEHIKERFIRGIILYPGQDLIPFDSDMIAMPLYALTDAGQFHN